MKYLHHENNKRHSKQATNYIHISPVRYQVIKSSKQDGRNSPKRKTPNNGSPGGTNKLQDINITKYSVTYDDSVVFYKLMTINVFLLHFHFRVFSLLRSFQRVQNPNLIRILILNQKLQPFLSPLQIILKFILKREQVFNCLPPIPTPAKNLKAAIICQPLEKDSMKVIIQVSANDPRMHL